MGWLTHNGVISTINMGPYPHTPCYPWFELFLLLVARGSTAVSSGDGLVTWGAGLILTHGGAGGLGFGNVNAWALFEDPDGVQHVFQYLGVSGGAARISWYRDPGGGFVGGAAGARPTSPNEVNCSAGTYIWQANVGDQYFHAIAADSAVNGRWPFHMTETYASGYTVGALIYAPLSGGCAADSDHAVCMQAQGGFAWPNLCNAGGFLRGYNRGAWGTVYADCKYWFGTVTLPNDVCADWDGNHHTEHPVIHHFDAVAGGQDAKGKAHTLAWCPTLNGGSFPVNHNTIFEDQNGEIWYYLWTGASGRGIMLPGWPDLTTCPLPDLGGGVNVESLIIDNVPADSTPPTITPISPTVGGPIHSSEPFVLDITDAGGLGMIVITVELGTAHEVVWLRDSFATAYLAGSSITPIATGYRFSLMRAGGWHSSPIFHVEVIDLGGNLGA